MMIVQAATPVAVSATESKVKESAAVEHISDHAEAHASEEAGMNEDTGKDEEIGMNEDTGKDEDTGAVENTSEDTGKDKKSKAKDDGETQADDESDADKKAIDTKNNYYYLSDLEYITEDRWSYAGWSDIMKDKNSDGATISLLIDGKQVFFGKGMAAHATSQLTYDISNYSDTYTRFVTKIGVDASKNGRGEVWFRISASNDGTTWEELYKSDVVTSSNNAIDLDLNVENYKYLRLYADSNGPDDTDHSVYADARVVKKDYDLSSELFKDIKPVAEYDEVLSKNSVEDNYNKEFYTVLKREFVNRMGYWTLQNTIKDDTDGDVKAAVDWIFNNEENLQLFIETGNVADPLQCLKLLSSLYKKHKTDLENQDSGQIYKKIMIALAISYCTDRNGSPLRFNSDANSYDIVERYEIIKELYDTGQFVRKNEFNTYKMELIRMVVNDSTANSEIKWLRGYSESKFPDVNELGRRLDPYNYMSYITPNYQQDRLYDQSNYDTFNSKYLLDQYGIPYGLNSDGSKTEKSWMVMEAGGICWNISRLGSNLNRVHGIPSVGLYQPMHESYFAYSENADGKGVWDIGNNIFGWGQSSTTWYGGNGTRLLFNWNNKSFTRAHMGLEVDLGNGNKSDVGNNAGYQLLGQAALNDYTNYQASFYYNLIANSYSESAQKEETYKKALEQLKINLDSYELLINMYKEKNRASADWKALAKQIIDAYTYYPMAMTDLLRVIEPYLDNDDVVEIDMLKSEALNKAIKATDKEVLQSNACREIANELLGSSKVDLASFSFDGENAGKIVMNAKYDDYNFQVQYSLDGGQSWTATKEHKIALSEKEIESISAENDIQVKISGSSQVFTIDILEGEDVSSDTMAMNDDENTFVGKIQSLEYSTDGGKSWKDYTGDIRFEGNEAVTVRYKAHGTYLQGNTTDFTFTEEKAETNKYIYVKNISFVSGGSAQDGYAFENMIDGNPFTTWHTTWGKVEPDKTYVVRLDKVRYLSQISYDPAGENGRIKSAKVYVSLDGHEWTLAGEKTDLGNDMNRKTIAFDEAVPAQYVKIDATETWGVEGWNKYVSGARFNYYEDSTKVFKEPVVEYSITSLTNQDVVATLKLPSGYQAVGEDTYTFTENGEHVFTYTDLHNKEKTIKAEVSWIDKEVPTATVEYDITEKTQFAVKATLKDFSKENVKVLNADEDGSHTFMENGTFVFELQDQAGNIGYVKAEVTWIEKESPDNLEIVSDTYKVEESQVISNIDAGTSREQFLKNIQTNANRIELLKDGKETDIVSTGSVLKLNDQVSYTLVVTGDIDGDGEMDETDLSMLNKHLVVLYAIKDRYNLMAADINQDGNVDIVDLSILNKRMLKK